MIGSTISHYSILEKLGEGGMGVVYKARDLNLDRLVALKFLPSHIGADVIETKRFMHEARAASGLDHPNICTFYGIDETDDKKPFIAMAYYDGETVRQRIKERPLAIEEAVRIAIAVAQGLAKAHEKGITHRDIKSDNIMLPKDGGVKIMDFGLASIIGGTKLTKTGATIGTVPYMSPEQARGEQVDHRTDIWSLGVVIYEMITGRLPFKSEYNEAIVYSILNEAPEPVTGLRTGVPLELERIVNKALQKNTSERYQHVDEMLVDLRQMKLQPESTRAGYSSISAASTPLQKKQILSRYLIPTCILLVVVLVIVIFDPFNLQIGAQKNNAASERSSLAVMYFQNIPDPEDKDHTGDMLSDLLITALSQTKGLEVMSRERLFDILKEFQTDSKSIGPEMATRIARRAGVTTMLLGSLLEKEPGLAVTIRLIDVASGNIIKSERVIGFTSPRIFSLVDTLALLIRDDLRVPTASPAEIRSVAEVTTKSPEAYRSYLEGVELADRVYVSDAIAAFKRAIELDSTFAMAYFALAIVDLGAGVPEEFQRMLTKAYELSPNITERERLLIQAAYASGVEHNHPKSIAILENLLRKYPHERRARIGLAAVYGQLGEFEKVNEIYVEGLQSDSLDKTLWNSVAYTYAGLHRRTEAMNAIERYLQLAPAEPNPYDTKGDIYAEFDDRDSAVVWWKKAMSFRQDFFSALKLELDAVVRQDSSEMDRYLSKGAAALHIDEMLLRGEIVPYVLTRRGELVKARNESRKLLASYRSSKLDPEILKAFENIMGDFERAISLDYELHDYPAMVRDAQEYSASVRNNSTARPDYGKMMVAIAQMKNGNPQAATSILEEIKRNSADNTNRRAEYYYGSGIISFEAGDYNAALKQMDTAFRSMQPLHTPLYHHAVCLLKSGNSSDAIKELNRLTRWTPTHYAPYDLDGLPFASYWLVASAKAHYWLGVAYEQQGQKEQAIKEYETFLATWKNADFDSKELKDAKVRAARLKSIAAK